VTDDLHVVAAEGIGKVEAAAQAVVGEDDGAAMVDGQEAAVDGGQDRLRARALARQLVEPGLELVRRAVEDAGQLADLVLARDARARGEVAGGEAVRGGRRGPASGAARAMASTTATAKARARARATERATSRACSTMPKRGRATRATPRI
jgi:hypothetical protein